MRQASRLVDGAHRGRIPRTSVVEHCKSVESRWLRNLKVDFHRKHSGDLYDALGLEVGRMLGTRHESGKSSNEKKHQQDCSQRTLGS